MVVSSCGSLNDEPCANVIDDYGVIGLSANNGQAHIPRNSSCLR